MSDSLIELEMKDIVRSLERADAELSKELVKEMRAVGRYAASHLQSAAPSGSGKLKKSIKPSVTKTRAIVKANKNAWFPEYGRKSYNPYPAKKYVSRTRERIDAEIDRQGRQVIEKVAKKFAS